MSRERTVHPPSGSPPPSTAPCGDTTIDLQPLAVAVADRYFARYPEHPGIASEIVRQWEVHDTCHLLRWAFDDVAGFADLDREVTWLADVLANRGFPLERLVTNLQLCAEVVSELDLPVEPSTSVADRLRDAADAVSNRADSEP